MFENTGVRSILIIKSLGGIALAPVVPAFVTYTARTGYGVWNEVHEMVSAPHSYAVALAPFRFP